MMLLQISDNNDVSNAPIYNEEGALYEETNEGAWGAKRGSRTHGGWVLVGEYMCSIEVEWGEWVVLMFMPLL